MPLKLIAAAKDSWACFYLKTNQFNDNGPFSKLEMALNAQKLMKMVHQNALDRKLIQYLIIEPDAPNISKDEPDWMKNGGMVANSA